MGFRLIFIIAIIISFTGKSTYLSLGNLEMGESETSEIAESKFTAKEDSKAEVFSLSPVFYLPSLSYLSQLSIPVCSLLSSRISSSCMKRGPPLTS
jgi:hypothetical protein